MAKFIESIKVLAVTTSSGENVFETIDTPLKPAYLIFSVPEELHLLLRKASLLNETIFPVQRNASYSSNPKQTRVVNTYIKNDILEQTINVTEQDQANQDKIQIDGGTANVIGGNGR